MNKDKILKVVKYVTPSIIVTCILLLIYLMKNIYPFGNMTIVQADLFQMFSPFYMHLWDVAHDGASFIYEYNLGTGSNIFGWYILFGGFSPITWLVTLTARENIVNFLSWMLVIRLALIAFTSYLFFNKVYKNASNFWKTIFSVMYALCGYVLIMHPNFIWLDNVMLFPLLILGIKKIVDDKKIWLYVLTLFLNLIICYQIAYMVLFSIISCMIIYLLLKVEKAERKQIAFLLGIGTLLALLLSSFLLVPSLTQALNSDRLTEGNIGDSLDSGNLMYKISFLLLSPIALFGYISLHNYIKKDSKNIICLDLMLLVTGIIQIIFERANMIWHGGSYLSFGFRFGFIPIFVLLNGGIYYFSKYNKEDSSSKIVINKRLIINLILYIAVFIITVLEMFHLIPIINYNIPNTELYEDGFLMLIEINMLIIFAFMIALNMKSKILERILIILIFIASLITFCFCYIGVSPEYRGGKEWSDEGLEIANSLVRDFNLENDNSLYRYRDSERTLNVNYPLITKTPSISSWLHLISRKSKTCL